MKIPQYLFAAAFAVGTSHGATVLSVDFDQHDTDTATPESLNDEEVTTGGTWTLNEDRGATYTVQESAGAGGKGLFLDDTTGFNNEGTIVFASLSLTTALEFSANEVRVDFLTGVRRVGGGKELLYEFYGSNGSVGASILWSEGGTVTFNDTEISPTNVPFGGNQMTSWDASAAIAVSARFTDTTVWLTFGDAESDPLALMNGVDDLSEFQFSSVKASTSSGNSVGGYLGDITVIPEPSVALLGGLFGLAALARRRR